MLQGLRFAHLFLGLAVLLLAMVLACGEEATPVAAPDEDISSVVQQAVEQALGSQAAGATEAGPSSEEIAQMVQAAVAASATEGMSPEQIQQMVQAALEATRTGGLTVEDLQSVVQSAVEDAVGQAVAARTPVATPAPTDAMPVVMEPTGILRVGAIELGVPVFVPQNMAYQTYRLTNMLTHEPMWANDAAGKTIPRLVREWTLEPQGDGVLYTFHLQAGAQWHTNYGEWGEFDADDFLFSAEQVTMPGTPHSAAAPIRRLFYCETCELSKVDSLTIQLKRPEAAFDLPWPNKLPTEAIMGFHSKKHFDARGLDAATPEAVGTGSWEMIEARSDDFYHMKAVRDHWRQTPEWEEFYWLKVGEESTRLANFLTGLIHTGQFTLDSINAIKEENLPDVEFLNLPGAVLNRIMIAGQQYYPDHPAHNPNANGDILVPIGEGASYEETCNDRPWVSCDRDLDSEEWENARKVRLAMIMAIDRQKLLNNLAFGQGNLTSVDNWVGHNARTQQFGLDELDYEFNPARGKELLVEAGYPDGFEIDVALTNRGFPHTEAAALMMQEIGITPKIQNTPWTAYRATTVRRTAQGLFSHTLSPQPEPLRVINVLHDSRASNNFGWEHPDWQRLVDEAFQLPDEEERWAKQAELARWNYDQVVSLPLYEEAAVWPLSADIGQWEQMAPSPGLLSNWEYVPHR